MSAQKSYSKPLIKVSATAFNSFGQCPMKYKYSRDWSPVGEEPLYFRMGREVHEIMEGTRLSDDALKGSKNMAKRLSDTERGMKIHVVHRELEQQFLIAPNVRITRKIDVLGFDKNGQGLIMDYKTSTRPWSAQDGWVPKAESWQTPSYLIPPPQDLLDEIGWNDPWPTTMAYMVVNPKSVQYFEVQVTDEWMTELHKMVGNIKDMYKHDSFYRNRGWTCQWCSFSDICQNKKGWKKNYESRP